MFFWKSIGQCIAYPTDEICWNRVMTWAVGWQLSMTLKFHWDHNVICAIKTCQDGRLYLYAWRLRNSSRSPVHVYRYNPFEPWASAQECIVINLYIFMWLWSMIVVRSSNCQELEDDTHKHSHEYFIDNDLVRV